jgi:hypothetical protein
MVAAGLKSLDWLLRVQTAPEGHFAPIGNGGWERGGLRSRFDQQPIEAQGMVGAALCAYEVTGDKRWLGEMQRAFDWFLGRNDLGRPLYDYTTGGCYDGLNPDGVNLNQGAESTLAFLLALQAMMRSKQAPTKEGQ